MGGVFCTRLVRDLKGMNFKLFLTFVAVVNIFMGVNLWRLSPGLRVDVLNVGQGDAILLTTPEQNHILIDGGPGATVLTEMGEVLPPAFRQLDLVVLTHPHLDHLAGLVPVLERFEVGALLISGASYDSEAYSYLLNQVQGFEGAVYFAEADTDFQFGSVTLDVLYPFSNEVGQSFDEPNNSSVVLKVEWGDFSVLLTGDAEKEVEAELLAAWEAGEINLEADVLKAGHHGSDSSSTPEFLEAVDADWMLISCGVDNSYGHPHQVTLDKAEALGMSVFRTDTEGRVTVMFGKETYWVR